MVRGAHWRRRRSNDDPILGHVFLCVLAFYLQWQMQ